MCSPTVSVHQEFRRSLGAGSGLVSQKAVREAVSQGCNHLKAWLGPEDSFPRWFTQTTTGRSPWPMDPSIRLLNIILAWWLASPRRSDTKEESGSRNAFSGLRLKSHIHKFLRTYRSVLLKCRRKLHRAWIPSSKYHWAPIYKLANTHMFKSISRDSQEHGLNLAADHVLQMETWF